MQKCTFLLNYNLLILERSQFVTCKTNLQLNVSRYGSETSVTSQISKRDRSPLFII